MDESQKSLQHQYTQIVTLKNEIEASRDFYRHIMANITEGIVWLDEEGKITFVNAGFRKISGYSKASLLGRFFWDLLSPEHSALEYKEKFVRSQQRPGEPLQAEFLIFKKNGEIVITETSFSWITSEHQKPGFLLNVRDVTERRKMERKLFASENRYKSLYENSPAIIAGLDPDGRFIYANPAMQEQSGYSEEELKNMHFGDLVAPDADFDVNRLIRGRLDKEARLQEVHYRTKAGDWKSAALNSYPIHDDTGRLAGIAAIGVDITETKRLNEQLVTTQRMDVLGQLAGGLAHDFNNILMAIFGYSKLLYQKSTDPEITEYANAIRKASERASDLTKNLLTFSRGEMGKRERVLVNGVVNEVKGLVMPVLPDHITLNIELPEKQYFVLGDSGKIHQCLLNLCLNARDAIGENPGEITLKLKDADKKDRLYIEVDDNGPGIPPDIIDKIFDPFFSTKKKKKGSGLGLSVVYGIVRAHNGEITLDSKPGQGTTFRIELPRAAEKIPAASADNSGGRMVKTGKVLIIDDESLVRGFCEDVLKSRGYSTVQFANGEDAVQWFAGNAKKVRFAVVDIVLPEMDGVETVKKMREIHKGLYVIWITGFVSPHMKKPPRTDPVLIKPFAPANLIKTVEALEKKA